MAEATSGATSRVQFRRGKASDPWETKWLATTVEPVIDGVPLSELVGAGAYGVPVTVGEEVDRRLSAWSSQPPDYSEAPDGFAPVLTCSCTNFGCGGTYAMITFGPDTVEWSDFRSAGYDRTVDIGPFVFDRHQYEQAILDFRAMR